MSDESAIVGGADESALESPPASAVTAGSLLRDARVAAGVHLESIAFSLKVPVDKIAALERDDASVFADTTFMRALASSVCRGLRIDPTPVLALMPRGTGYRLGNDVERPHTALRDRSEMGPSAGWLGRSRRWFVAAVLLLLIGAAAVVFTPQGWNLFDIASAVRAPQAPLSVDVMPSAMLGPIAGATPDAALVPVAPVAVASNSSAVAEKAAETRAAAISSERAPAGPAATSAEAAAGGAASFQVSDAGALAAIPADGTKQLISAPRLSFSVRGETWIQVVDSNRKILLERVLKQGDTASVDQPGKLSVVVGRANVTDVQVRGKSRDISKDSRDNVARFEVAQ